MKIEVFFFLCSEVQLLGCMVTFNFMRINCQTIFQRGRTTLFAHQQWRSGSVSPHPCRHLVVSLFFILPIHSDRCIVIPLLTNDWFPAGSAMKNPPAIQETDVWSLGQEDPLEKERATHCSILAWRILWTEEPGGLPSIVLQRVGHKRLKSNKYWLMMSNIFLYVYLPFLYPLWWNTSFISFAHLLIGLFGVCLFFLPLNFQSSFKCILDISPLLYV